MAIIVPADGAVISAGTFGKPVADAINPTLLSLFAAGATNAAIPVNVQTIVCTLTIPATSLPIGRHAVIGFGIHLTQSTAGAMDTVFNIGARSTDHQSPANAAGIVIGGTFWLLGDGTQKVCNITVLSWGGQPAVANMSNISALILPV